MKNTEPAFPTPHAAGLTKREYFAAAALQGFIACPVPVVDGERATRAEVARYNAEAAVVFADALIEALER